MNKDVAYTRYLGNGAWSEPQHFHAELALNAEMHEMLSEALRAGWGRLAAALLCPRYTKKRRNPPRKLRKCHLRKMERRRQRERRCWV